VTRLAQKARASASILIVATQRPSVDVITGCDQGQLPSRISYQVATKSTRAPSSIGPGAEKLLKREICSSAGATIRGIRASTGLTCRRKEINEIVDFVRKNQASRSSWRRSPSPPRRRAASTASVSRGSEIRRRGARGAVDRTGFRVVPARRLKLGYSRRRRLISHGSDGIVGPSQGSKPRDILIRAEDYRRPAGQI